MSTCADMADARLDRDHGELALGERTPLATFDEPLRGAARREGASLFEDV